MSHVLFKYKGEVVTLDTSEGKLLGGSEVAIKEIESIVDTHINDTLGGEPWFPFDGIKINDPYSDTAQFAMCLFYSSQQSNNLFPEELVDYLPYSDDVESFENLLIVH